MIKILLYGSNGKMGESVIRIVKDSADFEIVAGVDMDEPIDTFSFPTFTKISDCNIPANVIIDFSTAEAVPSAVEYAVLNKIPIIICTTALSDEAIEQINEASKVTPVLRSANMSVGINLLMGLLKRCASTLNEAGFDIEIVEKHHRRKTDAPSGTAFMLADAINESAGGKFKYVYERQSSLEKRRDDDLGILSLRGGTIAGEHDVIFAGENEIVELNHRALSNDVFTQGALLAAKFLVGKKPGLYSMEDIFNND
ncbi:MAG: 4-hydroxy-tetrahydrodipicolinate reductase [Defluviitaleaceae bacterium]|nr:4-hydroxy-tetrahydrodipicolinate reductase [Defluviitaleaceae bacterium]